MWNLCVTSKIIQQRQDGTAIPFGETLDFLKRAGFEEIDMSLEATLLLADNWQAEMENRLRLCEQAGIRIRYAHLPYHYPQAEDTAGWEDFSLATRRAIDFAVRAGADCAAIHPHTFPTRDYDPEKERARALQFLSPYQEYAVQRGFPLALENMRSAGHHADPALRRFGTAVEDVISLADELSMGICWDTGHGHISGNPQYESLVKIGHRLRMVHLNDNFAEDDVHLALFLGKIDWESVACGLRAVNYRGSLNTEVHCNTLPDALRTSYAAYMAEAVKKMKTMLTKDSSIQGGNLYVR